MPDAVTELESYAFSECVSLRSARLPGRRDLLGELIFSGCRALERIEEPSAVPPAFDLRQPSFRGERVVDVL